MNKKFFSKTEIKAKFVSILLGKGFYAICIVLIVIIGSNTLSLVGDIQSSRKQFSHSEYSDLKWMLDNKDYGYLLSYTAVNKVADYKTKKDSSDYIRLADYLEATMLYKTYKEAGKEEAQKYLDEMNELESSVKDVDIIEAIKELKEEFEIKCE